MKILGISGSLREGSYNTLLLAVASELVAQPVELEVFDLAGIPFAHGDCDGASSTVTTANFEVVEPATAPPAGLPAPRRPGGRRLAVAP